MQSTHKLGHINWNNPPQKTPVQGMTGVTRARLVEIDTMRTAGDQAAEPGEVKTQITNR